MSQSQTLNDQIDAPRKFAIEIFLEPFLRLCFPAVHALIDWGRPFQFLDTELRKLAPDHAQGGLLVDRLIQARMLNGHDVRFFIHVEVQGQPQRTFPERMWTYHYRLVDKFGPNVVSLAVLADADPNWRPNVYHTEMAGCIRHFEFPIFKVLDFADPIRVFERTGNPFALVIAAHQAALATRGQPELRYEERFRLLRQLRRGGLTKPEVGHLTRLLTWLTRLPREMELRFVEQWNKLPGNERVMTIDDLTTPWEEFAMEKGHAKGLEEGQARGLLEARRQDVLEALETRFGDMGEDVRERVQALSDEGRLRQALRSAITAPTLERFLAAL